MWRIGEVFARNPRRTSSFVRVLSCNLISERELSWCFVAVSVDFLVPMEILSWQIPTFALNKGAHLPLVPTRPHHVEVRRGFRDPRERVTHDCGADSAGIHLENDLLNNPFRLNMSNISKAVERALSTDLMQIDNSNPTVTITFCRKEVDRVTRIRSLNKHPPDLIEQKSLLYLLGQINRHMTRTTSCHQNFNGLKITSMSDRSKRMKLDDDNCYPLGILHIDRSRGLDLLPKRAARLSVNVYDVEMRNWSFLAIFLKSRATMIPSFARERKFETHIIIPDYHIVIIPCNSEEGCNL